MGRKGKKSRFQAGRSQGRFPTLSVAVLCGVRVDEGDDVVLHDIFSVLEFPGRDPGLDPGATPPIARPLLFVEFRSNGFVGKLPIRFKYRTGAGAELGVTKGGDLHFSADAPGCRWSLELPAEVTLGGLYWVEIMLDGRFITKLPLRYAFRGGTSRDQSPAMTLNEEGDVGGPYVSIATFAGRYEQTGPDTFLLGHVTHAIRRVITGAVPASTLEEFILGLKAVVRLIPGRALGEQALSLGWAKDGELMGDAKTLPVTFGGPGVPVEIVVTAKIPFKGPGSYELQLDWGPARIATVPLELVGEIGVELDESAPVGQPRRPSTTT